MIDENNKYLNLVDNQYVRVTERIFDHTILCTDIEHTLYKNDWSKYYLDRCNKYIKHARTIAPKLNKKYHLVKDHDWYTETV